MSNEQILQDETDSLHNERLQTAIAALSDALEAIGEPANPATALKQSVLVMMCRMIVRFKDQPEAAK